jgi:hypothetical protein
MLELLPRMARVVFCVGFRHDILQLASTEFYKYVTAIIYEPVIVILTL